MSGEGSGKLHSALGFAMKAGKLRSGAFAAEKALKSGKAFAAVIDSAASESTVERWRAMCMHRGVPLIITENLGRAIGKEEHIVACVTDNGFAGMTLKSQANPDLGGNTDGKN